MTIFLVAPTTTGMKKRCSTSEFLRKSQSVCGSTMPLAYEGTQRAKRMRIVRKRRLKVARPPVADQRVIEQRYCRVSFGFIEEYTLHRFNKRTKQPALMFVIGTNCQFTTLVSIITAAKIRRPTTHRWTNLRRSEHQVLFRLVCSLAQSRILLRQWMR